MLALLCVVIDEWLCCVTLNVSAHFKPVKSQNCRDAIPCCRIELAGWLET